MLENLLLLGEDSANARESFACMAPYGNLVTFGKNVCPLCWIFNSPIKFKIPKNYMRIVWKCEKFLLPF